MTIPDFNSITIKNYYPTVRELSNGIKTYCFNNNEMDVIFMKIIFYNAGTVSQDKFFTASLTKTQLNQGTKDFSDKELADNIDYYGLNSSHTTGNERTVLDFSFMQQYQKEVLPLIEQMVKYPTFPENNLQITINNSKQDYMLKQQQTNFLSHRAFMSNLFGKNHPYGKYAEIEDYDKVKAEDLKAFYKKRYSYNQCYILLSGNVNEEFYSLLDNALGKDFWNKDSADTNIKPIDINYNPESQTIFTHLPSAVQASIVMGRFVDGINSENYVPLSVLNCLFGGYFNSRLMSNIREEKGYTYGINSVVAPFKYGSIMFIATDVAMDKYEQTLEEIDKEMCRLKQETVSDYELSMVKNYMIGDMLRSNDGVDMMMDNYDYVIRYSLTNDYNSITLNKIRQITPEDIKSMAQKYLNKENFITSIALK